MTQKATNLKNKPDWKQDASMLKAVSLIGQLGLVMAISILLFVLLGLWLDRLLGWSGIAVGICSFLGIIAGGIVDYRILAKSL